MLHKYSAAICMTGSRMLSSPTDPALVVPASRSFANAALWTLFRRVSGERGPSQSKKEEICVGCGSGSMHSAHALAQEAFREAEARVVTLERSRVTLAPGP